jgi:hypothetical protein
MQPRRHRMRKQQRRDSARQWIGSGATITVKSFANRYGVDRYTAYEDLTALGVTLPASAQQWAQRPPSTPRPAARPGTGQVDNSWITLDGRLFFVAGFTAGGAPYGVYDDEIQPDDDPPFCGADMPRSGHTGTRNP